METQVKPFEFGISRILDCGFLIEEAVLPDPVVNIGYGMNFVYNTEENWVQFGVRSDFKQPETEITFLSGTVLTRFNVTNIMQFQNEEGVIDFPPGTLEALFGIAFSHMRAILAKNFAGSRFGHIIVPVINPTPLFKELFDINVQKFIDFTSSFGVDITGKKAIELFEINWTKKLLSPEQRTEMVDALTGDVKKISDGILNVGIKKRNPKIDASLDSNQGI